MRLRLLAGSASALALVAGAAFAQDSGVYIGADIGYAQPDGIEGTSDTNAPDGQPYDWTFSSDDTWAGFARLGYRFNPSVRVELEGGYRSGDVDSVMGDGSRAPAGQPIGLCRAGVIRTVGDSDCQPPEGEISAMTAMFNVIYDFLPGSAIRPFIGAGLGVAQVNMDILGQLSGVPLAAGAAPHQNAQFDDDETALAWQGLLGVAWHMSDRLSLDLTGRYLQTGDMSFGAITTNAGAPGTIVPIGNFEGSYKETSLSLGLRYQFGGAPAPVPYVAPTPPPEPAPQPLPPEPAAQPLPQPPAAQEFIVYFPWDEYYLTSEAQAVVQQAASYAQTGQAASVVVVGHADTSGSAAYNVRLSERRARTVADALVSLGVNQSLISADWRGETQPAVSTGDGVREPLNRRATITVNPGAAPAGM